MGEIMQFFNRKLEITIVICIGVVICFSGLSMAISNVFGALAVLLSSYYIYKRRKALYISNDVKSYHKLYLIFVVLSLVSLFFAYDKSIAFKHFMEAFVWRYALFCVIFFAISTRRYLVRLFNIFLGVFSISSLISLSQVMMGMNRSAGFSGGFLTYASILCMVFPIVLIAILDKHFDSSIKKTSRIALPFLFMGFVGNKSRASWLISSLSMVGILFTYIKSFKRFIITLLSITIVIGTFFASQPQYLERAKSITNTTTDRSNGDRIEAWYSTIEMIKDHPFAGVGLKSYQTFYNQKGYKRAGDTQGLVHSHNNFLQIAAETGALGLIGYISFAVGSSFIAFRQWRKYRNSYDLIVFFILLNYLLLFGQIDYTWGNSYGMKVMWVLCAIFMKLKIIDKNAGVK